jgi:recombinational DNA repair protein RecT
MWKKSAVRALTKYLPRSADMSQAAAFDEAPEYGKKQTAMLTHEVRESLEAHGVDVDGDETPEQVDEG